MVHAVGYITTRTSADGVPGKRRVCLAKFSGACVKSARWANPWCYLNAMEASFQTMEEVYVIGTTSREVVIHAAPLKIPPSPMDTQVDLQLTHHCWMKCARLCGSCETIELLCLDSLGPWLH